MQHSLHKANSRNVGNRQESSSEYKANQHAIQPGALMGGRRETDRQCEREEELLIKAE